MTALKPSPEGFVRGVASVRYPLNTICAHPDCDKPVESAHHLYPRSQIGNSSWFVCLEPETAEKIIGDGKTFITKDAIPHVIGLCGSGTTGHHGQLEHHQAWVKLNDKGEFTWYDRVEQPQEWVKVGALDPQPGGRQKVRKPRKKFQGEAKRKRTTISFKVPQDEQEDGAGLIEDALLLLEEALGYGASPRPAYYTYLNGLQIAAIAVRDHKESAGG